MAGKRIEIMELKQLIRLKKAGNSNRKVADLLGISRNTVNGYVKLFKAYDLSYKELLELDNASLEELFPEESAIENHRYKELSSYFPYFEQELRKPGCTLQTLWREYLDKHPDGYKHSQFGWHFQRWRNKIRGSCKLEHKAGEKLFVDFTGKKLELVDKTTGEVTEVNVFVGILPCSQYTFVKAVPTQCKEDFLAVLGDCLEFLGGVPQAVVSDNLKSAVTKASKYAPVINKTFNDFGLHYGCVIDPTRPYAPQDKALVEGAVNLVYQRIFYPLGKHTFFSLKELNEEIAVLLEKYNNLKFSQRPETRQQEFISLEQQFMQPLPSERYQLSYYKRLKVQKMGYIYLSDDKHYYSVPYRYIGQHTEVKYTSTTIEVFYNRERIALHPRDYRAGKYSTNTDHLSSTHKAYGEWSLEFFQEKAKKAGEHVLEYITALILERSYPEIGYKQASGILQLTRQYSSERVNQACKRAQGHGRSSYHTIANILKNGLEKEEYEKPAIKIPNHGNIRGASTYQ